MYKLPEIYNYEPTGLGIIKFHEWLMRHPKTRNFSQRVWEILLYGLQKMEEIHWCDARKNDEKPYIHHQIEMIIDYLSAYGENDITYQDLLVLALHDTFEEHPEIWRETLEAFGLSIFRDVLVLSTGGIPFSIRRDIILYFYSTYHDFLTVSHIHEEPDEVQAEQNLVGEIFRILNPVEPLFKNLNESQYREESVEFQKIKNAMVLYKREILIEKKGLSEESLLTNQEYLGLGNYIYFTPIDARRKLQDMLHNMGDMEIMEQKKPGYIQTRRIKAYILSAILRNFGMVDELSDLQFAFHRVNMQIPRDGEVYEKIK